MTQKTQTPFPTWTMRLALLGYAAFMAALLPAILVYIYMRARKDPRYSKHLRERFGWYPRNAKNCVWVHAVSLGELRAAAPLIRELLERGERVVITHFTPAGRAASHSFFAAEILEGRVIPVYVPLEYDWVFRRFFKAFSPKYGLVMEIEIWPRMIASAHRHKIPLFMCNGHYPEKSYLRDKKKLGLRAQLMAGFSGMFIKSEPDAMRFRAAGAQNVFVPGELRFDQEVPARLTAPAERLKAQLGERLVVTLASVVEGEGDGYIEALKAVQSRLASGKNKPLFIYVPRAPEVFSSTKTELENAGFHVKSRSEWLDENLLTENPEAIDEANILLGDSLGEMFFYLALADVVIVGGGFLPSGAHNIIEPLALEKTVLVGPNIWTIEFPAMEAIEAGALTSVETIPELVTEILAYDNPESRAQKRLAGKAFFAEHTGAVKRTLALIDSLIK
ncbi:MAG: 3-deoxy-D-manno-octulosonic acid transferase [Rhodobacteraceae bacterium]|nr:3-deoxy-D-manno-octulosonic acid transferase [Paracoccaceae bacterium]